MKYECGVLLKQVGESCPSRDMLVEISTAKALYMSDKSCPLQGHVG